jgi:CRISPR/Cas system-associated exonuclease Cas4 (RecB family)
VSYAATLSDVYDDFVFLDNEDRPRAPGIHASELYPCMRKSVYSVMDVEKRPHVEKFWKQRFKVGHALHAMLQNDFHRMAKRSASGQAMRRAEELADKNNWVMSFEDEVKIHPDIQALAKTYNIHSACDGIFTFRDRVTGEVMLRVGLEIKTASPDDYKGLTDVKHEHLRQGHLYMGVLDLPLMWFFYMNKGNQNNTNSSAPFLVVWRPEVWAEVAERCSEVLDRAARRDLPERTETVMCQFCPWSHACKPPSLRGRHPGGSTQAKTAFPANFIRKV